MALNAPRAWIICYDIANKKRLVRLHRFVKKFAQPVQYSVFYYEGSSAQLARRMQDIAKHIDPRDDDVRAYPIPHPAQVDTLGRGVLPDGVLLHSSRNSGLVTLLQSRAR